MNDPLSRLVSLGRLSRTAWGDRGQLKWLQYHNVDVAYVGWVNRSNLGDEAMFRLQRSLLAGRVMLPIPLDRKTTRLVTVAHPHVRFVLIGGGTLLGRDGWLRKVVSIRERMQVGEVVVLGAGMEEPSFGIDRGITSEAGLMHWASLLSEAKFVGVRGPRTQQNLAELGVRSQVVGDPALSIQLPDANPGDSIAPDNSRPIVAVNVASVVDGYAKGSTRHYSGLSAALTDLSRNGAVLKLFAMERGDMQLARRVFPGFPPGAFPRRRQTLDDVLLLIRSAALVISERLHGGILSANVGTPFLLLGYKPKCYDFVESICHSGALLPINEIEAQELARVAASRIELEALPDTVRKEIITLRSDFRAAHSAALS